MTVPKRVGMYFRGSGEWVKVAQFSLVDGQVAEVHHEDASHVVESLMTEGTWSQQRIEPVTYDNPEAFMTALLEPHNASYYDFRDES